MYIQPKEGGYSFKRKSHSNVKRNTLILGNQTMKLALATLHGVCGGTHESDLRTFPGVSAGTQTSSKDGGRTRPRTSSREM